MPAISSLAGGAARGFGFGTGVPKIVATGGAITTGGGFRYHTFNSSGTFTVTSLASPNDVMSILTVSSGKTSENGGFCANKNGAQGGSGSINNNIPITVGNFNVVVGTGPAPLADFNHSTFNGQYSSAAASAGTGGIGGERAPSGGPSTAGSPGWSTNFNALLGTRTYGGGGGGGGTNCFSGGVRPGSPGGAGGGGAGGSMFTAGSPGAANTGGGGGGAGANDSEGYASGVGGSGLVVIKYPYIL
jgi:hypothetical protein